MSALALEVMVRLSNTSEDAVLGKWSGGDQWLLSIHADGQGRVQFTVRFADNRYEQVDYLIPNDRYLDRWVHLAASFDCGHLRLYWNRKLVAEKAVQPGLDLASSWRPIHVGDAGSGVVWSRFDGYLDAVKIWRLPAAGACD